jgi:uncharacterized protein
MAHPNENMIRAAMAATCHANLTRIEQFDDNIVLHYPGHSPLSGDYVGQAQVIGWMRGGKELANGQRRITISTVLADDEHGVVLYYIGVTRGGRNVYDPAIAVLRIKDHKIAEVWATPTDLYSSDELWSRGQHRRHAQSG